MTKTADSVYWEMQQLSGTSFSGTRFLSDPNIPEIAKYEIISTLYQCAWSRHSANSTGTTAPSK